MAHLQCIVHGMAWHADCQERARVVMSSCASLGIEKWVRRTIALHVSRPSLLAESNFAIVPLGNARFVIDFAAARYERYISLTSARAALLFS